MRWVTRKRIHVNRTATGWLVRRFLDPDAEILFVEPEEVRGLEEREGALATIVHGADFPDEIGTAPECAGLWAISQGFTDVSRNDVEVLDRASFLYDSLYAHLSKVNTKR